MKRRNLFAFATAFLVTACGGGGGGSGSGTSLPPPPPPPPPPTVLGGQFKDANTEGLSFSTATQSGLTDVLGIFDYLSGETVEFSVGGVIIGSAAGASILTPIDLVAGGSSSNVEVRNIVRFLMLLDQNSDPTDGISISQAVRDIAVNWPQVDFSSPDLNNELVAIISDVASVDARTADLPDESTSQAHIESTSRCLTSGYFKGSFSGARSGTVIFLTNPATGIMIASFDGAAADFTSTNSISVDQQRGFLLQAEASNDNFEGRYDTYSSITGVWTIGADSGQFSALRILQDSAATYRYSGRFYRDSISGPLNGVVSFLADEAGPVIGRGFILSFGVDLQPTGVISNQSVNLTFQDGATVAGMIDNTMHLSATGSNPGGSPLFYEADGCRLN